MGASDSNAKNQTDISLLLFELFKKNMARDKKNTRYMHEYLLIPTSLLYLFCLCPNKICTISNFVQVFIQ